MMVPRLSICIATLNRAAFLSQTLHSIASQATDEIEIVIVDGASTDNTEQVVQQCRHMFPHLNYLRLSAKGGVDQDYCRAVELAQGDYCWLMSDDDLLKPGAIQAVLTATQHAYGLIIVNAEVKSFDFSKSIVSRTLPLTDDRVYPPEDFQHFLVNTGAYMSFIGCIVIKRQLWDEREKEKYFGSEFIHVGVIFQSPLPQAVLVIAEPWIAIRSGNASWTGKYFEIWMFKWPSLIWSFSDYPDEIKRQVCPKEPWRMTRVLMLLRAKGAYSLKEFDRWLIPRLESHSEQLLAKAIALLPGCMVNLPVLLYFFLFRAQERYSISEFEDSPFYYRNCLRRWYKGLAHVKN
jgi:abequosyltransferase